MLPPIDYSPRTSAPPPPPPAPPTPASPTQAGLHILRGPTGDNHFTIGIQGPDPTLAVGGSHDQQEAQRDATLKLEGPALLSYGTRHLNPGSILPREPSDASVSATLKGLNVNPPIGRDGREVTHAVYQSHIPNASPEQAYQHFVQHPDQVFGAGGLEIRPAAANGLQDGGRYMLESGGPPPLWLPIQVQLNPSQNSIRIQTLDGHPLRGDQTFTFTSDGQGGTTLTQDARFQASSDLVGSAQNISSVSNGQHETWQYAHEEIYRQFNGDPGYKGLGTSPLSGAHIRDDLKIAAHALLHPEDIAGGVLGTAGSIFNAGSDAEGRVLGGVLDKLHLPGSGVVKNVYDKAGDAGDAVLSSAGKAAQKVGHVLNPLNW